MRIDLAKFKELKQNDRIEYLLRKDRIEKKYSGYLTVEIIALFVIVILIVVVLSLLLRINFGDETFGNFLNGMTVLGNVFAIFLIMGILIDVGCWITKSKALKELDMEFFKFEVKPKK